MKTMTTVKSKAGLGVARWLRRKTMKTMTTTATMMMMNIQKLGKHKNSCNNFRNLHGQPSFCCGPSS